MSSDDSDGSSIADFNDEGHTRKRRRTSSDSQQAGSVSGDSDIALTSNGITPGMSRVKPAKPLADQDGEGAPIPSTIAEAKGEASLASRTSFATLGVAPWLVASLSAMQIRRPTTIQAGCIPEIINGRDCIGGSKTGSGKTLAFTLPILQQWARDPRGIFALILTPTRELALQIHEQVLAIGAAQQIKSLLITGGADQTAQALGLARNPHIVVATPGRLADHIQHSGAETIAGLRRVAFFVLDEADRLLEPGQGSMLPDVETCIGALSPSSERQTCLFTATVTEQVRALKDRPRPPGKPPLFVCELDMPSGADANGSGPTRALPALLTQSYLLAPLTHREAFLHALLSTPALSTKSTIVFANRASTAQHLAHMLSQLGHRVTALHSRLPQRERTANLGRFRARAARVLVATDVAARGLDIPAVELVVNADVPRDPDDYVHRVGRAARAGRPGAAVSIVGQRDVQLVLAIEARVGASMAAYVETDADGRPVDVEARVADVLKPVGEAKRAARLQIEMGEDARGKKKRVKLRPAE